jgi:transcriptional regulator with XRE-family HTH domain
MEEMMSKYTLKTARELNGLKQKDAAKLLGISVDTLRNYERGKSYPDIPILKKIEELYKLPYSRIIFLPLDYDKTVNII